MSLFTAACSQPEAATVSAPLYAPLDTTLFSLAVDDALGVSIYDATGRHHVAIAGSSVLPSDETAPDGSRALRFDGGWLEVTHALPESAGDFELAPGEDVTLSFYFKTAGDDTHLADTHFRDRMHLIGFGGEQTNFDVDLGDEDTTAEGGTTTALWTFWNGGGVPAIVDSTNPAPRHYYDDQWHHYEFIRRGPMVTVRVDGLELGAMEESRAVGSGESGTPNYIGRESVAVGKIMAGMVGLFPDASFPWIGSIAGVRLDASSEPEPPETEPQPLYPADCDPSGLTWSRGDLTVSIDPTDSGMDALLTSQTIQDAIAQYDAASMFFSFTFVSGAADIEVRFGGNELGQVFNPPLDLGLGTPDDAMGWGGTQWKQESEAAPQVISHGMAFLDIAETWSVDLLTKMTLHEFGHAISLQHCSVEGSAMHPTNAQALTLDATTLQALHALYL